MSCVTGTSLSHNHWRNRLPLLWAMVSAGLLLAGCTQQQIRYLSDPQQWQQKYTADVAACDAQARHITGSPSDERDQETFQRCMETRGWWQQEPQVQRRR
jgi:hypothetical protein